MTLGLIGILVALGFLIYRAFLGGSILLLAPAAAIIAAIFSGEPILANLTQVFMQSTATFIGQFFFLFLLGALFGKLMEDSRSVEAIADFMTTKLGVERAILAVVLAGALVTYGGVSVFVSFFVIAPMAQALFRAADIPHRLIPGAIMLGTATFTMTALPGTPSINNAIPMPFFGTDPFAAPGLGIIAALIMFAFGMWWLNRSAKVARLKGEGYGFDPPVDLEEVAEDSAVRERATMAQAFDPAEAVHGALGSTKPSALVAMTPLAVVILVNLAMSQFILPNVDTSFLAEPEWGATSIGAVGGVWSVVTALFCAIVVTVALNFRRMPELHASVTAGATAAVLPAVSVASLVGFGGVVANLPAFQMVADWVMSIEGGPLVSLAVSTNILAALTGSASGGLTIALDALGPIYMQIAQETGLSPELLHRVAVVGSGALDSLPHNGAVVTLLAVCGSTHGKSYIDIVMACMVGPVVALIALIVLGSAFGSF